MCSSQPCKIARALFHLPPPLYAFLSLSYLASPQYLSHFLPHSLALSLSHLPNASEKYSDHMQSCFMLISVYTLSQCSQPGIHKPHHRFPIAVEAPACGLHNNVVSCSLSLFTSLQFCSSLSGLRRLSA